MGIGDVGAGVAAVRRRYREPVFEQDDMRMPNALFAFEPRMEMPMSRGPLPCVTVTPGLYEIRSLTVNCGEVSNILVSMLVTVCPTGL